MLFKWLPKELQSGNCHQDNKHPSLGSAGIRGETKQVSASRGGGGELHIALQTFSSVALRYSQMSHSSRSTDQIVNSHTTNPPMSPQFYDAARANPSRLKYNPL